jgi:catechol 2,3-dioxygenase-like lactoylglutathione lyase family enzyme
MPPAPDGSIWPSHLRPGAIRFGRASRHYEMTVAFYRDLVGLPVVGEFTASFGEDGTIFGLPDTTVQLEIVREHEASAVAAFDQLVLYLDDAAAVDVATAPLRAAGLAAKPDQHPYWAANGAVTYDDPDGREVVFAPWVYGSVSPADAARP